MSTDPVLSDAGRQLAEQYGLVLGLVRQCGAAVGSGDWPSLAQAAGALSMAADELSASASALTREAVPTSPQAVLQQVNDWFGPERRDMFDALHQILKWQE
ncbi:hypothetical protein ACEZCY_37990 [Streptacidiphilus sp. N1-12]|uniref:Uncharacterized protein n=2 Tax=Streptacidiphilus alkalitolerans TaxID=3342712 RepID=A0ABV6X9N7_9ACTN